jgi:hypothetical protein
MSCFFVPSNVLRDLADHPSVIPEDRLRMLMQADYQDGVEKSEYGIQWREMVLVAMPPVPPARVTSFCGCKKCNWEARRRWV